MMSFSSRTTSNSDIPSRILCGTLFFVYALHPAVLSHLPYGIPLLVARIAIRFMVIIVRFVLSIVVLVSLCPGIVSFKAIPLFQSFPLRSSFLNLPLQSACT
jgi:hypothetical protein